jgi:predicted signal transduction protein with EAL and GGDEF domain
VEILFAGGRGYRLPNRTLFLDRLGQALRQSRRRDGSLAVLFLDLDRFKVVNDSLGHKAGDRLLVDVAMRLSSVLRPSDTLARFGGDELTLPGGLVVEITESAIMEARAAAVMRSLKDLGVRLAMDDFGTGYSSLSHLRRFPLDIIKVDRSFVAALGDGQGSSIAGAIVSLARALGLRTVAEGIEDDEQRRAVRALGCDLARGYLFARPMPAEALTRLPAAPS